jgi:hypothetical protein
VPAPTPIAELNELLATFVRRVQSILADDFVGAYLTGSFALGSGDAASDCDFLVAVAGRVTTGQERGLRDLHAEIPTWPGYWARNLEGSYASKADLETLAGLGRDWLYIDRGHTEMAWSTHCNAEDVRWVLHERAPVLAGVAASEFVADIPGGVLRDAMHPRIERFADDLRTRTTFDISWAQRYAVESPARMLYTLEHGEVISKPQALEWALDVMPDEWHGLIRQVSSDRFVPWNTPPPPGSVERTKGFVEYVRQRARTT